MLIVMYPSGTNGKLDVANVAFADVVALIFALFNVEELIVTALIVPPVITTAEAFCVDIVPRPDTAVLAIAIATLAALVILP